MGLYALALVLMPFAVGAFALIMDRVERTIVSPPEPGVVTTPAVTSIPTSPQGSPATAETAIIVVEDGAPLETTEPENAPADDKPTTAE